MWDVNAERLNYIQTQTGWVNALPLPMQHLLFSVCACVCVFDKFRVSGSAIWVDGMWSLHWLSHTCQRWQSSEVNSQGRRGEELKASCDDFLALAQPSTSAHQQPSPWWRACALCTMAWWGSVRGKIKQCVCVCVCLNAGLASRFESPPVAMFYSVSCCSHACHSLSEPAHSNRFKGYCRLHIRHRLLH